MNKEKANAIAIKLDSEFQKNNIVDYDTEREVNETVIRFLRKDIPLILNDLFTHTDEIKKFKRLSNKKTPNVSGITNVSGIKNLSIFYIPGLTLLFIFKFNHFPHYWKTAITSSTLKPSKPPEQASSYRPISLLDSLSKLAEIFIARQ